MRTIIPRAQSRALVTTDGSKQWEYSASTAGYAHAPAVGSNMLAFVDEERTLRCLVPRE
ncbi:hypothetical protein ACFQJ7_12530 [Halovenus rubra]|uniref:Uncharacterized protein n=2 Tax=Halovenus rubra TaxID=869890 RepID=A0ABD5XAC4_9EURY|nr:hypothetical protein [Halovenus rubra]